MMSNSPFRISTFLGLCLLVMSGCQSTTSLDTDAIIRINGQMMAQFQQEQHQELSAIFSDSVEIRIPGNYQTSGNQMIQAYWKRFVNPVDLTIKHMKFFSSAADLLADTDLPATLKHLATVDTTFSAHTNQSVYQWALWRLEYESEDGVIRHDSHPTLLLWQDEQQTGWRINWMAQI